MSLGSPFLRFVVPKKRECGVDGKQDAHVCLTAYPPGLSTLYTVCPRCSSPFSIQSKNPDTTHLVIPSHFAVVNDPVTVTSHRVKVSWRCWSQSSDGLAYVQVYVLPPKPMHIFHLFVLDFQTPDILWFKLMARRHYHNMLNMC